MAHGELVILSAAYGHGHNSVAESVKSALLAARPDLRVTVRDFFDDFVSPRLRRIISASYVQSVRHAPCLYGALYHLSSEWKYDGLLQRRVNSIGRRSLAQFCRSQEPALALATYCTPGGVLGELKKSGTITTPAVTLITDYALHAQWLHPAVDLTLVGAPFMRDALVRRGLDPKKIAVTGIPISPKFGASGPKEEAALRLGLDPSRPIVLVMAGAFGMMRGMGDAMDVLIAMPDVQGVFVCGRQPRAVASLSARARAHQDRFLVTGFRHDMPDLMAAADVCVTKAGGVTVSEALASGLPLIIYKPIPGQEQRNTDYLIGAGAAQRALERAELARILANLLANPDIRAQMSACAARIARPDAAAAVAREVLRLLGTAA